MSLYRPYSCMAFLWEENGLVQTQGSDIGWSKTDLLRMDPMKPIPYLTGDLLHGLSMAQNFRQGRFFPCPFLSFVEEGDRPQSQL